LGRGKRMCELYLHSPNTPSWRGAQLKAHGQPYLYLCLYFTKFYQVLKLWYMQDVRWVWSYILGRYSGHFKYYPEICL